MDTSLLFHKELLRQSIQQWTEGSATTPGFVNSGTDKVFWNTVTICDSDPQGRPFESTPLINHTTVQETLATVCDLKCINECRDKKGYSSWRELKKNPSNMHLGEILSTFDSQRRLLFSSQKQSRYFVDLFYVLCLHCEVTYERGEWW